MSESIAPLSYQRFIKPEVLSRISNMELLARTVVEGFVSGLHKSPYKGFSVEFMEYRPYMPGDDPLRVDWKLYGRTDRYYVKEFEDETNTRLNLVVDMSGSMGYTSGTVSKLDYAQYLAASLAYFMYRQRDAVGITFFDEKVLERIPPRSTTGHMRTILAHLDRIELGTQTSVGKPLHQLAETMRRRGLVVVISDLLDEPEAILEGLQHFRYEGHEVIVFHIMDRQEVDFDFSDVIEFEDMETGEKILLVSESAKAMYKANLEAYLTTLKEGCASLGIDYSLVRTDQPLDFALFEYLAARRRLT